MYILQALLSLFSLQPVSANFYYPDPTTYFLENMLVGVSSYLSSGFADAITPCTNYVSGPSTAGRMTASQWIRNAFHDFITADVAAGTGGIDASIRFETGRTENAGSAMNDSLAFFALFFNSYVSMADIIALSVVVSVGNCGGMQLQATSGRVDAGGAGSVGLTPGPTTPLDLTLLEFLGAGFDNTDAIALVACGHTVGAVHHDAEPTIVDVSYVTTNNTSGGDSFDVTPSIFDNTAVSDYLSGRGAMGGPLVTTANESARSDLRLFESDGNVTVGKLADSNATAFAASCGSLFQRMIDTVPSDVTLTDVVPQYIKPIDARIELNSAGAMFFSGYIRVLMSEEPDENDRKTCISIDSTVTSCLYPLALSTIGSSPFGFTYFYFFSLPILEPYGFTNFKVIVEADDGDFYFTQVFPVRTTSFLTGYFGNFNENLTIGIATSNGESPTSVVVELRAAAPQAGSLSPVMRTFSSFSAEPQSDQGTYILWEATLDIVPAMNLSNAIVTLYIDYVLVDIMSIGNIYAPPPARSSSPANSASPTLVSPPPSPTN